MEAQTEGETEKDESVRRTSWSWPGGPEKSSDCEETKEEGRTGGQKKKVAFQRVILVSSSTGTVGMAPEGRPLSGEVC